MIFTSIDVKIMLHRATDFAKEASALQKKDEIAQSYFVKHTNEKTELQKTKIQDLQHKEDNVIKRDKEQKGRQNDQKPEDHTVKKPSDEEPEVGSSTSVIDIRI